MNKQMNFAIFAIGAVIGSVATWRYVDNKYKQIAQEEIDSMKDVFSKREREIKEKIEEVDTVTKSDRAKEKPNIVEYATRLRAHNYTNYSDIKEEKTEIMTSNMPYVINPEEFGDLDEYDTISLTYYSDGILADGDDNIIDNPEDVVGSDALNSFGQYEDDSAFVRDDRLKCDYEILLDQRKYSYLNNRKPHEVN